MPSRPSVVGPVKASKGWVLLLTPTPVERETGVGVQAWVGHCRLCSGLLERQQPREHVTPPRREAEIRRGIDLSAASKRIQALPAMGVDQRLCRECSLCPALPPLQAHGGGRNLTPHHAEAFLQSGETPLPSSQGPTAATRSRGSSSLPVFSPGSSAQGQVRGDGYHPPCTDEKSRHRELKPRARGLGNPHAQGIRPSEVSLSDGRSRLLPLELPVHPACVDPRKAKSVLCEKGRMGPASKMSHFRHLKKIQIL